MDLWYSEAATAIAEFLNGYGFPLHRDRSLRQHEWWPTLEDAMHTLLTDHFKQKHITIVLDPIHLDWLIRRARSRRSSVKGLSPQDMVLYDIMDVVGYYNMPAADNPPLGYIIPESFSL
jgi:hypothetical protein